MIAMTKNNKCFSVGNGNSPFNTDKQPRDTISIDSINAYDQSGEAIVDCDNKIYHRDTVAMGCVCYILRKHFGVVVINTTRKHVYLNRPCESEAVAKAEHDWNYLTPREQARREISACVSEANEDGEFNLGAYDVIKKLA